MPHLDEQAYAHPKRGDPISCDVHAGMYSAMEKAGHAHDKKRLFIFCISEAKRLEG